MTGDNMFVSVDWCAVRAISMNLLAHFHTIYTLYTPILDYIWVVNCNCKCNYVSYCNFYGVDRSLILRPRHQHSFGLYINTIQLSVPYARVLTLTTKNQMHFISNCGTILTKTNFGVSIYVLTLLRVYRCESEWAKRNQIVIITNKQF